MELANEAAVNIREIGRHEAALEFENRICELEEMNLQQKLLSASQLNELDRLRVDLAFMTTNHSDLIVHLKISLRELYEKLKDICHGDDFNKLKLDFDNENSLDEETPSSN